MLKSQSFRWMMVPGLIALSVSLANGDSSKDVTQLAQDSLNANIVQLPTGSYLSAGSRQFRGFWTRDFSFASRGLLVAGRTDVIKDTLTRILSFVRAEDGLVPRYLDNLSTTERYAQLLIGNNPGINEPLKPNYAGGGNHSGQAIDSNSLVLLTALEYVKHTGDTAWWDAHEAELVRVYRYHDQHLKNGLIVQGKAADWQDSVRREGRTFYTNLLYWVITERLQAYPRFEIPAGTAEKLKEQIIQIFRDPATGLYLSIEGHPQISLDGLLLAIDLGFHTPDSDEARALYAALKAHPLWTLNGGPGFATYPNYPDSWVEPMAKLSGMDRYHDETYWSWLMALSSKIAYLMGDLAEGERIMARIEKLAQRDGGISEVYSFGPELKRKVTTVYRSEIPFSWGAGVLLDALETRRQVTGAGQTRAP